MAEQYARKAYRRVASSVRGSHRLPVIVAALAAVWLGASALAHASASSTTFVVTSTADTSDVSPGDGVCDDGTGTCSLRAAIEESNALAGGDVIDFGLPGTPPFLIVPSAAGLPPITDPVTIDATTQAGYSGTPLVELQSSTGNTGNGLVLDTGGSAVRGLAVDGFLVDIVIDGTSCGGCGGNTLEDDYVGLGAKGEVPPLIGGVPSSGGWGFYGVEAVRSAGAEILHSHFGGISEGPMLDLYLSDDASIRGNSFGTNPAGTGEVSGGDSGFAAISDNASGTVIGGSTDTTPDGPCTGDCNLISPRGEPAITVSNGTGGTGYRIEGNYVGTDVTGETLLSPPGNGDLQLRAGGVTIGGSDSHQRNVIGTGITLDGAYGGSGDVVQGNYIGTDATGTKALSTLSSAPTGVELVNGATDVLIGGTVGLSSGRCTGDCNLISGNAGGITTGSCCGNAHVRIEGNYIGTDVSGSAPIPNFSGVSAGHGEGTTPGGLDVTVGGLDPSAGNLIAFNVGYGVGTGGSGTGDPSSGGCGFGPPCLGVAIVSNRIFANGNDGICCPIDNDSGDTDTGANDLQNYPVITDVSLVGGDTVVSGTLNSRPGRSYELQFFRNHACDQSFFYGQGEQLWATADGSTTQTVVTDGSGSAPFTYTFPGKLSPSEAVTATATDEEGNYTSGFSQCTADLSITKTDSPHPVQVGQTLTYTLNVHDAGPEPATGVDVYDQIPSGETLVAGSPTASQGSCSVAVFPAGDVTCDLGDLGRDESATITIEVQLDPSLTSSVTNTACTDWAAMRAAGDPCGLYPGTQPFDPDGSNNSATVTTPISIGENATIVVEKKTVPGGSGQVFQFTGDLSGSIGDGGSISRSVAPGVYSTTEQVPGGWALSSISCDDAGSSGDTSSGKATFNVSAGQTVTCTYTDTQASAKTGALTMGFWQNKNGQAIIEGQAKTGTCPSATWLRQYAPFQDLSSTSKCSDVAAYVYKVIKGGGTNCGGSTCNALLKAQMLATALDVYFSNPALGGNKINAPAPIGGIPIDLTKICTNIPTCSNFENDSGAFGGAASMTVLQTLAYAAGKSNVGGSTWYGNVKAAQVMAKDVFDAINNQVAFTT